MLVESLFYDGTMNLANSYQGVAGYTNVVDVCGRVVETRYFGEDGLPCESYQGFAIERFSYDGFGRIAQVAWFDRFGRPTFNCEGVHGEKRTYGDDKGRLTQCEQLTIDGCYGAANASGFAKATYEYDDGMRTTRLRIWDRQDTPCCYPAAAWSEVIQKTDERGRVVESEYRGVTGSLTNGPHGGLAESELFVLTHRDAQKRSNTMIVRGVWELR